jgi:transcriptional regulator with XRE-family HTH domain
VPDFSASPTNVPRSRLSDVQRRVGKRVKALRALRGLTQEQFAEKVGVSVPYLQRLERGAENSTLRSLVKLANALDVDVAVLVRKSPE